MSAVVQNVGRRKLSPAGRGFALPVVLLTLAALSAMVVVVIPKGRTAVIDGSSVEQRTRDRFILEAGLSRGLLALLQPNDPMTEALRRSEAVPWTFADRALTITVSVESTKLDLNEADPGILATSLEQVLGPELGRHALDRAQADRGRITMTDQLLPLDQRFSASATRLAEAVTVYGGQIESQRREVALADGSLTASGVERPIYTVRASFPGQARARAVTVLIEPEGRRFSVLERMDLDSSRFGPVQ